MTSGAKAQPLQAELAFDEPVVGCTSSASLSSIDGTAESLLAWAPENWPVVSDWRLMVEHFFASSVGRQLGRFVTNRLAQGAVVYPPAPLRALEVTALADVRVVIVGQDPYHGPGQAHGLAFSVAPGVKPPPSLRNMFKEIARDKALLNRPLAPSAPLDPSCPAPAATLTSRATDASARAPGSGSLLGWAQQGVLLINTCLTVEQGQPAGHANQGWEVLTDAVVGAVAARPGPVVFMLWGAQAQAKQDLIASAAGSHQARHLVLTANHPSPLSALRPPKPFIGCSHFSLANLFLQQHGLGAIKW